MTQQEVPMVRVSGTITDWAKKKGQRGEFTQIKLQQEGRQYPITISDFKNLLADTKKGDHITLDITETTGEYQGKPVTYRNAARLVTEAGTPTDQSSSELWDAMGATTAKPPTPPASPPAPASHTQDTQRASIEAQVAAKIASEILRDILTTVDGDPVAKVALARKHLPELTMIAVAAIHEASRG